MSGIAGIVQLDAAPADEQLLRRMTAALAFRGPDAQAVRVEGPVGFGHTLLRTTDESARERQPCTLDGCVHIVADARIDARHELRSKLAARGRAVAADAPDPELILHAYHAWGEECLEHLLGDFAFAIWDAPRRRLFCARDHFGVKPFYYARAGHSLVFSNTLNCVRMHPGISDLLNEQAIGDFLLFGFNQEPSSTFFAGIQKLPHAHCLSCDISASQAPHSRIPVPRRYWTLPQDPLLRYKRPGEYVEHFLELFRKSVDDRLRTRHAGVLMSGGLDSTSVAAIARERLAAKHPSFDLRAHCIVYRKLIPDVEETQATSAAQHLGIPVRLLAADEFGLFAGWEQPELRWPEPCAYPLRAVTIKMLRELSEWSCVALSGDGGDVIFYPSPHYVLQSFKHLRFGRLATEIGSYLVRRRKIPRTHLRSALKRQLGIRSEPPAFPEWLEARFVARAALRDRWKEFAAQAPSQSKDLHRNRPEAAWQLAAEYWRSGIEEMDPGVTGVPVEIRHPYVDCRLVRYALSVPPIPWCVDKELVRVSMQDLLPPAVCRRAKTPLAGDPVSERLRTGEYRELLQRLPQAPELAEYVNLDQVLNLASRRNGLGPSEAPKVTLSVSLSFWLKQFRNFPYNPARGGAQ